MKLRPFVLAGGIVGIIATIVLLFTLPANVFIAAIILLMLGAVMTLGGILASAWDHAEWVVFVMFLVFLVFGALRLVLYDAVAIVLGILAVVFALVVLMSEMGGRRTQILRRPVEFVPHRRKEGLDAFYEEFRTPKRPLTEQRKDDNMVILGKDLDRLQSRLEMLDRMMRDEQSRRKEAQESAERANDTARAAKREVIEVRAEAAKEADRMVRAVNQLKPVIVKRVARRSTKTVDRRKYVMTLTGKSFHKPDCLSLRRADRTKLKRITLVQAKKESLKPCTVCKP